MTMEQLFQEMLSKKLHKEAEHLAELVDANVQELYRVIIPLIIVIAMLWYVCRWQLRIALSTMTLIMPYSIAFILRYVTK